MNSFPLKFQAANKKKHTPRSCGNAAGCSTRDNRLIQFLARRVLFPIARRPGPEPRRRIWIFLPGGGQTVM